MPPLFKTLPFGVSVSEVGCNCCRMYHLSLACSNRTSTVFHLAMATMKVPCRDLGSPMFNIIELQHVWNLGPYIPTSPGPVKHLHRALHQ